MSKRTDTSSGNDLNTGPTAGVGDLPPLDAKSQQILAALAELGEATAGGLAEQVGIAYSTATPKLRKLSDHGLAETTKAGNGQTIWRLTAAGTSRSEPDTAGSDTVDDTAHDTTAENAAADVEAADESSAGTETAHDLTTSESTTDESTEDDAAQDEPVEDGTSATDADDLADTVAGTLADSGTGDGHDATAKDADTTITDDRSGDAVEEPVGGNGDDAADQTLAEALDGGALDGTGSTSTDGTFSDPTSRADAPVGTAPIGSDEAAPSADAAPKGGKATGTVRRTAGSLDKAILAILQARPGVVFKVGELCKLIDKAEEGIGVSKASPGAVVLAGQRLVGRHPGVQAVEKPAGFLLLPGTADQSTPTAQADAAEIEVVDAVTAA